MHTIGVDWGSTAFRAYLLADGTVVDRVEAPDGLKQIGTRSFEAVLFDHIAPWVSGVDTIWLAGMVTSRSGWVETGYLNCPADCRDLARTALPRLVRGKTLHFLPGLSQQVPVPDVMRGEEVQLCGLDLESGPQIVVMPGTHSKWVRIEAGRIQSFRTIITGELYRLLLEHSLVGQLAEGEAFDQGQFDHGVEVGFHSGAPVAAVFAARSSVLTGQVSAKAVASYLSGVLIGNEIREGGVTVGHTTQPITVIGANALVDRYMAAFSLLGHIVSRAPFDIAATGFARIAAMELSAENGLFSSP